MSDQDDRKAPADPAAAPPLKPVFPWATGLAVIAVVIVLVATRTLLTEGTEADFLGAFRPDAQRIVEGEAPRLPSQPPIYTTVLALTYNVVGDWAWAGWTVSLVSSLVLMVSVYILFTGLLGRYAGWGALLALAACPSFIRLSAAATTDVFFTMMCFLVFLSVYAASRRPTVMAWAATGLVLGLTLLTRANGIALVPVLVAPLLAAPPGRRAISLSSMLLATGVLLVAWAYIASQLGVSFIPGVIASWLSATYFGSGDASQMEALEQLPKHLEFAGPLDIFLHDPVHVTKVYISNLFGVVLPKVLVLRLLVPWLALLALPGLVLLVRRGRRPMTLLVLLTTLAHLLLVNIKTYETRFYLFVVPVLGAGIGLFVVWLRGRVRWRYVVSAVVVLVGAGLAGSSYRAYRTTHDAFEKELLASIPRVDPILESEDVIVARKPHISYYTRGRWRYLPSAESIEDLRGRFEEIGAAGRVFLYYGVREQRTRGSLGDLARPDAAPSWLVPRAQSEAPGGWVLYEVRLPGRRWGGR